MSTKVFSTNQRRRAIKRMLVDGGTVRGVVLQELFGVTERTIVRDIHFLRGLDLPVVGMAGHGYILEAGYKEKMFRRPTSERATIDRQSLPWYSLNTRQEAKR